VTNKSRPFRITTGTSRLSKRITRKKIKWETLAKRLTQYGQIDCTYEEYMALPPDQQADLKDQGWFVGGQFNGPKRLLQDMARRCCLTLDIDHADPWDVDEVADTYADYAFAIHSTAKHSSETPRLRLVLPLTKDIHPDKYEPVAREVARWLGLEVFDDTTFQPARIMYWPTCTIDGEVYSRINPGEFIDPDEILATYDDWTDFGEWPHSSRVDRLRKPVKQAEDPLSKPGIIGAFCRTYDIHSAIEKFELPYEPTEFDNRYRPEGASGASGAIVYDDVFLYSHHESDVAAQQNLNAFDLVRVHRFPELVAKESDDMPMGDRPSYRAMSQLAISIPAVNKETHVPADEMEAIEEPVNNANGKDHHPPEAMLTFAELRREMLTISNLESHDQEPACDAMKPKIAAARLSKTDNSRLAGLLRELYPEPKPTKKSIEDDIKDAGKRLVGMQSEDGELHDMEQMLVQAILEDHFSGGDTIKRVGKKFWTYEDGLWRITDDEWIKGKVLASLIRLREQRPSDELELVAVVEEGRSSSWLRSLFEMFGAGLAVRESVEDPLGLLKRYPLPIVNTRNAEIHFDVHGKRTVREQDPSHFFTHRIDVVYDPTAKCPEWDRFCELIFSESSDPEDMQRHLEELGGYIIGMSRWLKTWVLFHGTKDTGKSTVADVFRSMLGGAYLAQDFNAAFGINKSQFAEANLIGKLALVDDDYDKRHPLPDGFIKKISEEKTLTADIKYGAAVQMVCRALPIILSNHWPVARDVSDAFRERALVFPFRHRIAGRDRDDQRRMKMLDEGPGILNRFLAGLSRLRERGDWDVPMDCADARDMWEYKSNPAAHFIHDCLERGAGFSVTTTELWNCYKQWVGAAASTRGSVHGMGRNEFYERMDALLGARVAGHGGVKRWETWRLKAIASADEMDDDAGDVDAWDD
jgi:P4 family phage/plasmid primase-like protien